MNNYWSALIIGIVEGLTEFLPVSSTAHIRFAQELLGLPKEDEYWKMFAVVIQLGAILSVVFYFWRRLLAFIKTFPSVDPGGLEAQWNFNGTQSVERPVWQHPLSLVMLAFVVTAVPCFIIDKKIGE